MKQSPTSQIGRRLVALNELHRNFWEHESGLFRQHFDNSVVRQFALDLAADERIRRTPVFNQMTLEAATERAAKAQAAFVREAQKDFPSQLGKTGGRPKRADALQAVIEQIVAAEPKISTENLLKKLVERASIRDVIDEVGDEDICFMEKDEFRCARRNGLKDRLTRARKTIAQRG